MILAPVGPPVSNIDLINGVILSPGLVPLFCGDLSFAEIVTSEIEAIVAGLRCLEIAICTRKGTCVVAISIFPSGQESSLNNRCAISVRIPRWVGIWVRRVIDLLTKTRGARLSTFIRNSACGASCASNLSEGVVGDGTSDAINSDFNFVKGGALKAPAIDIKSLSASCVALSSANRFNLWVRLHIPAVITSPVAVL